MCLSLPPLASPDLRSNPDLATVVSSRDHYHSTDSSSLRSSVVRGGSATPARSPRCKTHSAAPLLPQLTPMSGASSESSSVFWDGSVIPARSTRNHTATHLQPESPTSLSPQSTPIRDRAPWTGSPLVCPLEKREAWARPANSPHRLRAGLQPTGDKWWDLCAGPHVDTTGNINTKAVELESVAGAFWRGDEKRPMMQRIYGTAWENEEQLKAYIHFKEEAKRRDHRRLGQDLDLFSIQLEFRLLSELHLVVFCLH